MSFPDHNSHPPLPIPVGDGNGFWPQFPVNPEHHDSHSHQGNGPPFKRQRNFENHPQNAGPLPQVNPMMNQGGKGTSNIFYKTRICAKFVGGTCRNGEHCTFAHGKEDLREPPPNWQELLREKERVSGNWNDDHRIIQKMKLCIRFYNGEECPYGEKCTFLHERPASFTNDMPRQRESSAISIGTTGHMPGSRVDNEQLGNKLEDSRVKPVFWKTKICSKWEMTGDCPFGERCHFAHGHSAPFTSSSELHVPGGRIEAEPAVNSGSIQIKPLSIPVVDSSPASAVAVASKDRAELDKKMARWKLNKKVDGIYADWIDDLSPPRNLPSTEES